MAIDFPNSPNTGDIHSDGGASWRWSGYAWRRIPDPGAKGEPGEKGQKGEIGSTGSQGDKGDKGAPSTVAGAKGDKGDKGNIGFTGSDGAKGEKGEPSTVAGDKGDKGDKGNTGAGTKGDKGAGSSVTIGVSPPTSPAPAAGDMWWDSDDADLHVYYNDGNTSQWVSVTSSAALKGQTGDKGDKGQKGELNDKGQKGDTGAVAAKGQKGEIGATGGSGGTGATGDKGQKGEVGSAGSTGIPSGFIGLWSGAANAIPSGWYLCNGSNGTPDLRGRFVVGYNNNDSLFDVNDTGGSKDATLVSHSHTINNHTHSTTVSGTTSNKSLTGDITKISECYNVAGAATGVFSKKGTGNSPVTGSSSNSPTAGVDFDASHDHTFSATGTSGNPSNTGTNTQGSSATNANLPPYYALAYIMKA